MPAWRRRAVAAAVLFSCIICLCATAAGAAPPASLQCPDAVVVSDATTDDEVAAVFERADTRAHRPDGIADGRKPLRMVVAVGTRPESIKLGPVVRALLSRRRFSVTVVHTGQHPAPMLEALALFGVCAHISFDPSRAHEPGERRRAPSAPRGRVPLSRTPRQPPRSSSCTRGWWPWQRGSCAGAKLTWSRYRCAPRTCARGPADPRPPRQGDTTSVLSLALAAYHERVHVVHVEAGGSRTRGRADDRGRSASRAARQACALGASTPPSPRSSIASSPAPCARCASRPLRSLRVRRAVSPCAAAQAGRVSACAQLLTPPFRCSNQPTSHGRAWAHTASLSSETQVTCEPPPSLVDPEVSP